MGTRNALVAYTTPRGNDILLLLPYKEDDPCAQLLHRALAQAEPWAKSYLDTLYREMRERENRLKTDISSDSVGGSGADYFASSDRLFTDVIEERETVRTLLSLLNRRQAEAIYLHVLERMPYKAISQEYARRGVKITAEAVRKNCSRGLQSLRKELTKSCPVFPSPTGNR